MACTHDDFSERLEAALCVIANRFGDAAAAELADALRMGGHIEVTINAPPAGGLAKVEVLRRRFFNGAAPVKGG